ncbi:MAG TPA: MxaK protein [Burkholderiales bacterium]
MELKREPLRRWRALALLVLAAAGAVDGWNLVRIERWNRAIADGSVVEARGRLPAEAQFAQAYWLERRGAHQDALARYQALERGAPAELAAAAQYNGANIYLRWALELRGEEGVPSALPLLELAKQSYRDLLRAHPRHWDARYNLERALRLAGDVDAAEAEDMPQPLESERAVTTMRGFTLGLP